MDPRGYPIIAVIPQAPGEENYGALAEKRKLALATYDLCAVCGMPFRDELRWQVTFDNHLELRGDSPVFNEAPVHEICALYAAQVWPFVSSPHARLGDEFRKGQRRAETLVLAGFDRTAAVFGHESELQTGSAILMFEMGVLGRTHVLTDAAQASTVYETALSDEAGPQPDDAERRLVDILCAPTSHGEDSGGVMAGAAWFLGAAFCPKIRDVQGMGQFADAKDDFYFQLAATFLFEPDLVAEWTDVKDPSTAAAAEWFRTREQLPGVLQQWRAGGASRIRDFRGRRPRIPGASAGVPRDAAIRRRKDAEAALRKRRRRKP